MPSFMKFSFRDYDGTASCPVKIVTPSDGYYIHTFFDTDPISPSGKYLACLKLPFQDRIPASHDQATVCIIDLENEAIAEIYQTKGWGMQVGAHICWGDTDEVLLFNDKEDDRVFTVVYNIFKGEAKKLEGAVYQTDGDYVYSPNLKYIDTSQNGYGAAIDPKFNPEPTKEIRTDEGLWKTSIKTGKKELILSIKDAYDLLPDKEPFENGRFVFFHTKVNRQRNRIFQVVRVLFDDKKQKRYIVTMDMDGGNPKIALPYELWLDGSHHPDWHPDGKQILMNINLQTIRFCLFAQDGSSFRIICPQVWGGGHPSFNNDASYIATDAYTGEKRFVTADYKVPIRLIDVQSGREQTVCRIWTLGGTDIPAELRCDPHPVWHGDQIIFNGTPEGNRQILIAAVSDLLK